jgi:hypothetical protein
VTSVLIWFEREEDKLWAVADSRVSARPKDTTDVPAQVLTDHAIKLLPLLVKCFTPDKEGFFAQEIFPKSFGFAYAGATLPATMCHAYLNACLQNLFGYDGSPPAIAEIAQAAARIIKRYCIGPDTSFETAIFGICPRERKYKVFHITPFGVVTLLNPNTPIALGNHCAEILEKVNNTDEGSRRPLKALRKIIQDGTYSDVGGDVQIGYVDGFGFHIASIAKPINHGNPTATRSFLGIDLDEMGQVGNFSVGGSSLA